MFGKFPMLPSCCLYPLLTPPAPDCSLLHSWKVAFSYLEANKMPDELVRFSYAKYRWRYL